MGILKSYYLSVDYKEIQSFTIYLFSLVQIIVKFRIES